VRAITLLSGGLDSVVATWAARREHQIVLALTFDYGQRAAQREYQAAVQIAEQLQCPHKLISLPWLGRLGDSALTNLQQPIPAPSEDQIDSPAFAQAVWVPNRNGIFLNIAAAHCEALNSSGIVCGFNAEEAATFPDNSPEFMEAAENFFTYSTGRRLHVLAPTAHLTKAQIVQLGRQLAAPLHVIWSCYQGGEHHCWQCESCLRLRRALVASGLWETWQQQQESTNAPS